MKQDVTKIKGIARSYYAHTGMGWSFVVINEYQTRSGFYTHIGGDYGNYGYGWSSYGDKTPEEALLSFDRHYLQGKFEGMNHDFDASIVVKELKEMIIQDRKQNSYSAEIAKKAWDEIDRLETGGKEIMHEIYESPEIMEVLGNDPSCIPNGQIPNRQLTAFFDKLWPHFQDMFKEHKPEIKTA